MTQREEIGVEDLPGEPGPEEATAGGVPSPVAVESLKEFKEVAEKAFIIAKLEANDWNISKTAKEIDTPRSNLYKKLEQYGIAKSVPDAEDEIESQEEKG
jgi:two-component system nitrogen regulation response regulator NtrX